MNRKACASLSFVLFVPFVFIPPAACIVAPAAADDRFPETLPNTAPLTIAAPLDEVMVDGIDRFALRAIADAEQTRNELWDRDYSNPAAYSASVADNRGRLRTYLGAVDSRDARLEPSIRIDDYLEERPPAGSGTARRYRAFPIRWQALAGVTAEGLVLVPDSDIRGLALALPDADWTPEMFVGMAQGVEEQAQLAKRLAEQDLLVLVPTLISRDDTFSGHPDVAYTNQPHREFVYRMAFEMGRHVIGYEVQKVLAGVDLLERLNERLGASHPIGVAGVGEGGLIAFYSAALDERIGAALVSGYFQPRDNVWEEPIYRNVWRLLSEFGDANVASLIAPRSLVIEACAVPTVDGPPEPRPGRRGGAAPGKITIPDVADVQREFERAAGHYEQLGAAEQITFVKSGDDGHGPAGSSAALEAFLNGLGHDGPLKRARPAPVAAERPIDAEERQGRQVAELVEFTQQLMERSARVRDEFWSKAARSSLEAWEQSAEFYRDYVWRETFGKLPEPTMPNNPRTRKVLDKEDYQGYEVVLDVYPDVIAAGILLLPTDLEPDERRPVVVCQHGLEGTPMHTITGEGSPGYRAYKAFSAQLVRRGFIVYAPQNPYRGRDRFRTLQRKSNPMGRSLFSYIIPQHQRTLDWLASLPNVDPERIGFYGLSYGGKTAVRVPPMLTDYGLSICSADFNEWVRKNVTNRARYSYIFTGEYEMFEWNLGHVANYAELAMLMTPRPFMVERGHDDGVAPDEWVAWEYAKVRRHYNKLGLGKRTEIEFFDGPHTINGQGTFSFLHRHLDWPEP